MSDPEVARVHETFHALPYGKSRVRAAEDLVTLADSREPDLSFQARIHLMDAAFHGGDQSGIFAPFTWCVSAYDDDPERYASKLIALLWRFKWLQSALTMFPQIPLASAHQALEDMERRYRTAGRTLEPVYRARHRVARHLGDADTAEYEFQQWRITPRDPQLSDCIGCDPTSKAGYLLSTGRAEEAIAEAQPVLSETLRCSAQPHSLLTTLMPAYMETGRFQEASRAQERAYPRVIEDASGIPDLPSHILFCSRTGNQDVALAMIERHGHVLDEPPSPMTEMRFAASGSHALARAAANSPRRSVWLSGREQSAGAAAEALARRALDIAGDFDRRNGTTQQSDVVRDTLQAEVWTKELRLHTTA